METVSRTKRRREQRESPDMAAFVARVARGMVRRAGEGDLEALTALTGMRKAIDEATDDAAAELHRAGYSWTDIGRETGTTRQNARQRWGQ